jgi:hypothetical protein
MKNNEKLLQMMNKKKCRSGWGLLQDMIPA